LVRLVFFVALVPFFTAVVRAGFEDDESDEEEEDPELEPLLSFDFLGADFWGVDTFARRGGTSLDPDEEVLELELEESLAMIENDFHPVF
jgi:hypothetical protein